MSSVYLAVALIKMIKTLIVIASAIILDMANMISGNFNNNLEAIKQVKLNFL
jgi:hypothetical protein